jgi:predicted dehydrogenase
MRRREFLRQSAAAVVGGVSFPYVIPSGVLAAKGQPGANDRIQIGFIGLGGRAKWILTKEELPGAQVVSVADCFLPRCEEKAKLVEGGQKWSKYQDYRHMLEKEKLDAVFVATPTHARVLISMHALQAGLDVYAEKPLTLTIAEGRALARAARKHDRVVQVGTQQRSMPINMYASKLVREGAIGKVHTVMACNFIGPERWTPKPTEPMPDGLDWDQWCNQTELRPYHRDLQFGWMPLWDYDGGGQSWGVTGWGAHALDQVQCALGTDDTGPVEIWPEDSGPQAKVTMRYASGTLLKIHGAKRKYEDLGAIFMGDRGTIDLRRGSCVADPPELLKDAPPPETTALKNLESLAHLQNFFDCMRSRQMPNAHVEAGHRASTVCHLINICRELGRKLKWDPKGEAFVGDGEANAMVSRPRREGYALPAIG